MNLSRSLTAIIIAAVLLQGSQQDCISSDNLALIGFTANVTTTTGVCTDLFANNGGCVDAAQIQASFNTTKTYLAASVNLTLGLSNVMNTLSNSIKAINGAANNITSNINGTINNIGSTVVGTVGNIANISSVSDAVNVGASVSSAFGFGLEDSPAGATTANATVNATVSTNANVNANATVSTSTSASANGTADASTTALDKISANAKAALNTCYQNYENLVNGMYCYLTSNQATTYGRRMASDTTVYTVVNVDVNSTGTALATCLPLIDAFCTTTYGVSLSANLTSALLSSMTLLTADSPDLITRATCKTLKSAYGCTTDDCTQLTYLTLINDVFSASTVKFFQNTAFLAATNSTISTMSSVTGAISSIFGLRALQTSSGHRVEMAGNPSGGQNVNQNGQSSGASKTTYYKSSSAVRALAVFATILFTTLFA